MFNVITLHYIMAISGKCGLLEANDNEQVHYGRHKYYQFTLLVVLHILFIQVNTILKLCARRLSIWRLLCNQGLSWFNPNILFFFFM